MSTEINETTEFWQLLVASQLVPQSLLEKQQASLASAAKSAKELATFLVSKKLITEYQAKILLSGASGPFHFGNYCISTRYEKGPLEGQFKARHRGTQHPVCLQFLSGTSTEDLLRWQSIEKIADRLAGNHSTNLISVYETVVMPQYRFVVSERPRGVSLAKLIWGNQRMDWKQACGIFAQVARGIQDLRQAQIEHRRVCPENIWVEKTKQTQLRVELTAARFLDSAAVASNLFPTAPPDDQAVDRFYHPPETLSDIFSLGCCLGRVLRGKPIVDYQLTEGDREKLTQKRLAELKQLKVPEPLVQLIQQMIADEKSNPLDFLKQSIDQLESLAEISLADFKPSYPNTLDPYLKSITLISNRSQPVDSFPAVADVIKDSDDLVEDDSEVFLDIAGKSALGSDNHFGKKDDFHEPHSDGKTVVGSRLPRTRKIKSSLLPIVVSLLVFLSMLGGVIYFAGNQSGPTLVGTTDPTDVEIGAKEAKPADTPTPDLDPLLAIAELPEADRPTILQNLIDDDQKTLWQSPTEGAPLQFTDLPIDPRLIFDLRLSSLISQDEGVRLIHSLGPQMSSAVGRWESISGIKLSNLARLTISLHSSDSLKYQPFFVCELVESQSMGELMAAWQEPNSKTSDSGVRYFETDDQQWAFGVASVAGDSSVDQTGEVGERKNGDDTEKRIQKFVMGAPELVGQTIESNEPTRLAGPLRRLVDRTDRDRHINILFLRQSLFNDEGIDLMGSQLREFNRQLNVMLPDSLQGGLISCHLDSGTYLELQAVGSRELRTIELKDQLEQRLRQQRNQLTEHVFSLPSSSYWDRVRSRMGAMLVDVFRNLRWGIEHGEVVANAWLPPMAAHNLIAAAELAIYFSEGADEMPEVALTRSGPQTLEQLLEIPRDLEIANPPDLNLLLRDLQDEIREQYPALPFVFKIRLMGPDLQLEGITQNQRPGELKLKQTSLADILTYIMTSANPVRDISGPSDPRCKLVWVIADDVEQEVERTILITTRAAAQQNGYVLPKAFQLQDVP